MPFYHCFGMVMGGGENVYPREVEEFLYTHPDILDAQVIGVPADPRRLRPRPGDHVADLSWLRS